MINLHYLNMPINHIKILFQLSLVISNNIGGLAVFKCIKLILYCENNTERHRVVSVMNLVCLFLATEAQYSSPYFHCVLSWLPNRHLLHVSFCLLGYECLVWAGAHSRDRHWAPRLGWAWGDWAVIPMQAQEAASTFPRFFSYRFLTFLLQDLKTLL